MRKVAESRDIMIFELKDSQYEVRRKLNGHLLVKTADLADAYNELRYYQDDRDFRKKLNLARFIYKLRPPSFDE
jgi:hypothetical protein